MLENTDKSISDLLNKLPDIIQSASNQLPDIAQQMLVYGAFDASIGIGIGIFLTLIGIGLGILAIFSYDGAGYAIFGGIALVIGLLLGACTASTLYEIKYAPKLYLLEKAADMIKPKCK